MPQAPTPGSMRERARLQKPTQPLDDFGDPAASQVWETVFERFAAVKALVGRELKWAQSIVAEATYLVQLRHVEGFDPKWRVVWLGPVEGVVLQVHRSLPTVGRTHLELLCSDTGERINTGARWKGRGLRPLRRPPVAQHRQRRFVAGWSPLRQPLPRWRPRGRLATRRLPQQVLER